MGYLRGGYHRNEIPPQQELMNVCDTSVLILIIFIESH